mmetsp:Transcript_33016/g.42392  ORF Transcript_33016/g.42392 Transcript_33016/m.42392 type:complete len:163 (+) Transcript_33016:72-560(+)
MMHMNVRFIFVLQYATLVIFLLTDMANSWVLKSNNNLRSVNFQWKISNPSGRYKKLLLNKAQNSVLMMVRKENQNEGEQRKFLWGSGLNGRDISKLKGNEKRDAEWFARQAEREANRELNIFEDPVFYGVVFIIVPALIYLWAVDTCYIPIVESCYPKYEEF